MRLVGGTSTCICDDEEHIEASTNDRTFRFVPASARDLIKYTGRLLHHINLHCHLLLEFINAHELQKLCAPNKLLVVKVAPLFGLALQTIFDFRFDAVRLGRDVYLVENEDFYMSRWGTMAVQCLVIEFGPRVSELVGLHGS
ncbi:hypothetical protein PsorP6_003838 [Peronosclerospora sorghi]|uniref:Uncharacterized protein n=1 Tax=Peronosclerospora sorghi TaxID=230839 RepID=A0ACC0VKH1_9STRA|nr:hypothetical protein PsorP6_003838 [Peronosclerospora sorghi]